MVLLVPLVLAVRVGGTVYGVAGIVVGETMTAEDTFVVWSSKTLQNNKALISTTIPDGMYYEITSVSYTHLQDAVVSSRLDLAQERRHQCRALRMGQAQNARLILNVIGHRQAPVPAGGL